MIDRDATGERPSVVDARLVSVHPELAKLVARDLAEGVHQQIVRAVVTRQDRVLLLRRPAGGARGGEWEFPGGKVEAGDADLLQALRREVREETGLRIAEVTAYLAAHDYTTRDGLLARQHTWSVTATGDRVRLTEHDAYVWASTTADELTPLDRMMISLRGDLS
ncbi:hypothetical protein GCM10009854_35440 [Saccharopolyspora halophila]|uniref:8-oxo-dGTP diphosphatase n=1 Tax=Saccharopolyspora halophila TaxID=405551 RepID=A0ABP5TJB7_9PSEU